MFNEYFKYLAQGNAKIIYNRTGFQDSYTYPYD